MPKVQLFLTCLGDQFYTGTLLNMTYILKRLGGELTFPPEQTCCGHPLFNNGFEDKTRAVGGVISLANPFPEPCYELYRLFKNGDLSKAKELYHSLLKLNRSISGTYDIAGLKAAMELNVFFCGEPRLPLLP